MRGAFVIKFLLLAIFAVIWSNAAAATAESCTACALTPEIVLQSESEYCCTLKAEPFNLSKSDNAKKRPCTCRSQANGRIKDAFVANSFRWHLSTMSLFRHQYPIWAQTHPTRASAVHSFANKPQLYILNACLLI